MMLSLGLLLLTLAPAPALQDAATDASAPSPPEDWLVLEAIDGRGRRPFRPDGVLQEYVVKGRAPKAGESLGGERGTHAWNAVEADDRGRVRGSIGYAYAGVELDEPAVVLAKLTGASTLIVNGRAVAGDLYGYGWGGLPVALEAGANDVFVTGVRGGFKLAFEMPPADTPLAPAAFRHTLPQLVVGEPVEGELGLCVRNASRDWLPSVTVEIRDAH